MPTIITALALVTAAVAVIAALQVLRRERARSDARVAALAGAIDPPSGDEFDLFNSEVKRPAVAAQVATRAGIGALVVVTAVALLVGTAWATSALLSRPAAHEAAVESDAPLSLVSMRHERKGETLTITGLVRNDANRRTEPLIAVVFAFDKVGDFVASARAPIDLSALAPGEESAFRVAVPHVPDVGRYRVSFRTDAGLVRHLDRRSDGSRSGVRPETSS